MKKYLLLMLLASAALAACSSSSSSKSDSVATAVDDRITAKDFTITVTRASPPQGKDMVFTSSYLLQVEGNTVKVHLPYFGRAYSASYDGGQGLNFQSAMTDYTVTKGKKDKRSITFNVRTSEALYRFNLEIWPNGRTGIMVSPDNRQTMNYQGTMEL